MNNLQTLQSINFTQVGKWCLLDGKVQLALYNGKNNRNVMYCYVVNEEVLYVGKTVRELWQRLYGYQNPGPSQRTNIRVHGKIKGCLEKSEEVEIYALLESPKQYIGPFEVNIAAGLEDAIIDGVKPIWNVMGVKKK